MEYELLDVSIECNELEPSLENLKYLFKLWKKWRYDCANNKNTYTICPKQVVICANNIMYTLVEDGTIKLEDDGINRTDNIFKFDERDIREILPIFIFGNDEYDNDILFINKCADYWLNY